MQNDLLMLRVAQSQNQRSTIASNKDIRRNLSTATGSVRIMDPNSDPDSPRKSTLNDDPAAVMRSSLLRASLSERDDDIKTKHLSQLGQHFVVKSGTGGALSLPSAKRMSIVSRSRNTMITQGESVDGPMSLAIAATAVDSTQVVIDLTSQFDAQSEVPVINSNLLNVPPPHAPTRASNVIDSQSVQQSNPESEDSNNSSIDASHEQNQSLVPPDENTDFVSTLITSDSAKETVPNSVRRPPGGEISGGLNVDRSGNAGLNATQRNKEFFKKVKEVCSTVTATFLITHVVYDKCMFFILHCNRQQEETKKKEDEAQRDPAALAAIKENEMIQEQHDKNKTAHYSKLGSTFAVKDMRSTAATRPKKNVA